MPRSWSTSPEIADATIPNIYKAARVAVVMVSDMMPGTEEDPIHETTGPYLLHVKGITWESEEERNFLCNWLRFVADDLEREGAEEDMAKGEGVPE